MDIFLVVLFEVLVDFWSCVTGSTVKMEDDFMFFTRIKPRNILLDNWTQNMVDEVPAIHLGAIGDEIQTGFSTRANSSSEHEFFRMTAGKLFPSDLRDVFANPSKCFAAGRYYSY